MVIREAIAAIVKMCTAKAAEIWSHLTAQIRRAANPWATVKGPLGSLYMHLQEIGWSLDFGKGPEHVLSVFSHADEQWTSEDHSGWIDIQRSMEHRRAALLWEAAATHRNGQGMEKGVDLTAARKHYCTLIKCKTMGKAGALMAMGAGALWPDARIMDTIKGKEDMGARCKKCGHPNCYEEHMYCMYWGCPQ